MQGIQIDRRPRTRWPARSAPVSASSRRSTG